MLTPQQLADYERDGFLVLPDLVDAETCDVLVARAADLIQGWDPASLSVFTTDEQTRTTDEYFLASGGDVRFFVESEAVASDGSLTVPKEAAVNKIGHALHDLDPVFADVSHSDWVAALLADVGMDSPLLLQSMFISKGPRIGGEVGEHDDATFLWTDPVTVTGIWLALQDATVDNGCLWAVPGGHKWAGPARRFVRTSDSTTDFVDLGKPQPPHPAEAVPLEAKAGTVVLLHGLLPHRSSANRSDAPRAAYTLHAIDASADYPDDSWLLRPDDLPLRAVLG